MAHSYIGSRTGSQPDKPGSTPGWVPKNVLVVKWQTHTAQDRKAGGSSPLKDTKMRAWRNGRRIRLKIGTTKGSSPFAPTKMLV